MKTFYFEVNKEMSRARVVLEYTYPDEPVYGLDGGVGPRPTFAQLPGLSYDPSAHAVVYDGAGKRTICATVQERKSHFGSHLRIRNTGSCVVTLLLPITPRMMGGVYGESGSSIRISKSTEATRQS